MKHGLEESQQTFTINLIHLQIVYMFRDNEQMHAEENIKALF